MTFKGVLNNFRIYEKDFCVFTRSYLFIYLFIFLKKGDIYTRSIPLIGSLMSFSLKTL